MQSQLECFLWSCTNTGDQWYHPVNSEVDYVNHTGKHMTFAKFMTSDEDVKILAMVFNDYFERSPDYNTNHNNGEFIYPTQIKVSERADNAQDFFVEEGFTNKW